ncbi:MAG: XdhC family protein [Planctomycetes bacterium]|nr:XdhC family protein [Planctomycetota bacterium]
MILKIFESAQNLIVNHVPFAFAIVTNTKGSVPISPGSIMLVKKNGDIIGTVGGSDVEEETRIAGLKCIQNNMTWEKKFQLSYKKDSGVDLICGGEVQIWAIPLFSQHFLAAERIVQLIKQRQNFLLCVLKEKNNGKILCVDHGNYISGCIESDDIPNTLKTSITECFNSKCNLVTQNPDMFLLNIQPLPKVLLCGGGNINYQIAEFLDKIEYFYSVFDTRDKFASKVRFPKACELLRNYDEINLNSFTHTVVATHAQSLDYEAIQFLLKKRFDGYIGLIGSKSKKKDFSSKFQQDRTDNFELVDCPMGVNIPTSNVEEIAISVTAKLIDHSNTKLFVKPKIITR